MTSEPLQVLQRGLWFLCVWVPSCHDPVSVPAFGGSLTLQCCVTKTSPEANLASGLHPDSLDKTEV